MHARFALAMLAAALPLALAPALAFDTSKLGYGSLFLGDIDLIDKTPKLKREIDAALATANKKFEEQMCESPRFHGPWDELHGEHVAPFVCHIGSKWLQINATVRLTGRKGEVYETDSAQAMKRARKISQTSVTWAWTDDDPRERH